MIQYTVIFEDVSEMEKYKDNVCYPDGLTKPLEVGVGERYDGQNAYKTLQKSLESLTHLPPQDVSAIESIIYNQRTSTFTYSEVVEEKPYMKAFGNSFSTRREKGKTFQM